MLGLCNPTFLDTEHRAVKKTLVTKSFGLDSGWVNIVFGCLGQIQFGCMLCNEFAFSKRAILIG